MPFGGPGYGLRSMSRLGWALRSWSVGLVGVACGRRRRAPMRARRRQSSSIEHGPSDVPERPPHSTDTTVYDPATVEGEVEAAYLRSWEVYADAVWNLDYDTRGVRRGVRGRAACDEGRRARRAASANGAPCEQSSNTTTRWTSSSSGEARRDRPVREPPHRHRPARPRSRTEPDPNEISARRATGSNRWMAPGRSCSRSGARCEAADRASQ